MHIPSQLHTLILDKDYIRCDYEPLIFFFKVLFCRSLFLCIGLFCAFAANSIHFSLTKTVSDATISRSLFLQWAYFYSALFKVSFPIYRSLFFIFVSVDFALLVVSSVDLFFVNMVSLGSVIGLFHYKKFVKCNYGPLVVSFVGLFCRSLS